MGVETRAGIHEGVVCMCLNVSGRTTTRTQDQLKLGTHRTSSVAGIVRYRSPMSEGGCPIPCLEELSGSESFSIMHEGELSEQALMS